MGMTSNFIQAKSFFFGACKQYLVDKFKFMLILLFLNSKKLFVEELLVIFTFYGIFSPP